MSLRRLNNPVAATSLEFGQTFSASIDSDVEMDPYSFQSEAGDMIRVRMTASAALEPAFRRGFLTHGVYSAIFRKPSSLSMRRAIASGDTATSRPGATIAAAH